MHERDIFLLAAQQERKDVPRLLAALQDASDLYMYLEVAPLGSVWDAMEAAPNGRLSEPLVAVWTKQAGDALQWLHELGFAHRCVGFALQLALCIKA